MSDIILDKNQSKTIAKSVYDGIKNHCEVNFERFIMCYKEELRQANGKPIEPITISFNPISHFVEQNHIEDDIVAGDSEGVKE